ncbi:MAG: CRTAC1 family protein [Phycisphaerales bacterium]|nr:CRTAC1 family protein [Phycisphaerales bacterium]
MRTTSQIFVALLAVTAPAAAGGLTPFTEEAAARGITYAVQAWPQVGGYFGFGCAFTDLDGDEDPDLVVLGAASGRVGIYENDGRGVFTDRSFGNGIPLLAEASAVAAGDYDGDGDIDLYLTQFHATNRLLRNDGGFQFTDVTDAALVGGDGPTKAASFADYDGDGWLDLYVCNYTFPEPPGVEPFNRLYHNLGDGTFEEVAATLGVDDHGLGFQSIFTDYDRDGDVDLYVSNDRGHQPPYFRANQLWRNDGGVFVNVSEASGADAALFSMGVACGDFDNNRYPDFYCTNIPGGGDMNNPLLLNQGDGTFVDEAVAAGVDNPWTSWGAIFFDVDNDANLDLYVNNMWDPNTLFMNAGSFPCTETAVAAGVEANDGVSFAAAVADIDADGDLDLFVNNLGGTVELFINHEGERRQALRYRVVGFGPNVHAIGARVDTRIGPTWQLREILAGGNGYGTQNELVLHVGAGNAVAADEVVVSWPGGEVERTLTNVPTGVTWTLYPPDRLGDADGNGVIDLDDVPLIQDCLGQAFAPGCELMDLDGDSDVDTDDVTLFVAAYAGTIEDCDGDGTDDIEQIIHDPGLDVDGDGLLDSCSACPADLDGSGDVGFTDLLSIIVVWGPCPGCPADLDGSGDVGFLDLLAALSAWGPCP